MDIAKQKGDLPFEFSYVDRLKLVRLTTNHIPSRIRTNAEATKFLERWPAIVYHNIEELVRVDINRSPEIEDLVPPFSSGRISEFMSKHDSSPSPKTPVACLLRWKKCLHSRVDEKQSQEESDLELIYLSGTRVEDNRTTEQPECVSLIDHQLEHEALCDLLMKQHKHLSEKSNDISGYQYGVQWRKAMDVALNLIAHECGSERLPPREGSLALDSDTHVPPSHMPPPSVSQQNNKKRDRVRGMKKSKNKRSKHSKAMKKTGGSRLVQNQNKSAPDACSSNNRLCLANAICALLPQGEERDNVYSSIIAAMPPVGDTSIAVANKALLGHGIRLDPANKEYLVSGNRAYQILQEHKCRLILNIQLIDLDCQAASHFVAWDGMVIHDWPFSSNLNNTFDRTLEGAKNVFDKLYKDKDNMKSWRITSVYRLMCE